MKQITLVLVLGCLLTTGCASPWEQFYQANHAVPPASVRPVDKDPMVRVVPAERLQAWAQEEYALWSKSSVNPDDADAAAKTAARKRLASALQLPAPYSEGDLMLIGWCTFRTTEVLDLRDPRLVALARKKGAEVVASSSQYVGKEQRVAYVPLTTFSQSSFQGNVTGGGYSTITGSSSGTSTTMQPIPVTAHFYEYACFFVTRRPK